MEKTLGRWPTKYELLQYYQRNDVCEAIYTQSTRWQILLEFGKPLLLDVRHADDVRDVLFAELEQFTFNIGDNEKLQEYPTMHILTGKGKAGDRGPDYVLETDPPRWVQAFEQISTITQALDQLSAYYLLKFSGRRSVHLIIPAETMPTQWEGQSLHDQWDRIQKAIDAYLPLPDDKVDRPEGLRVAYSTHPKSGYVSLPILSNDLRRFKPWNASLHTIEVDSTWPDIPPEARGCNTRLLEAAFGCPPSHASTEISFLPAPTRSLWREDEVEDPNNSNLLNSPKGSVRLRALRQTLTQDTPISSDTLRALFNDPEPDVVWLSCDLRLYRGDQFTTEETAHLLAKEDECLQDIGQYLVGQMSPAQQIDAFKTFLLASDSLSIETALVLRKLALSDKTLLESILSSTDGLSLDEWFKRVFIVCGSALVLGWRPSPVMFFENTRRTFKKRYRHISGSEQRLEELEWLFSLYNGESGHKRIAPTLLIAAKQLEGRGFPVRTLVEIMLRSDEPAVEHAARQIVAHLEWEDAADLLVGELNNSEAMKESARRALLGMGSTAVPGLIGALRQVQSINAVLSVIDLLGRIGSQAAIMPLRELANRGPANIAESARNVANYLSEN